MIADFIRVARLLTDRQWQHLALRVHSRCGLIVSDGNEDGDDWTLVDPEGNRSPAGNGVLNSLNFLWDRMDTEDRIMVRLNRVRSPRKAQAERMIEAGLWEPGSWGSEGDRRTPLGRALMTWRKPDAGSR